MNSNNKAAISLTTGLEDPERVTVAFLVALGAAEAGRPTMMFLAKEAARLAVAGIGVATACDGCPPLAELMDRYERAGGRYLVCPLCVNAKKLDSGNFIAGAEVGGTVQLWQWIGDGATTFSYCATTGSRCPCRRHPTAERPPHTSSPDGPARYHLK